MFKKKHTQALTEILSLQVGLKKYLLIILPIIILGTFACVVLSQGNWPALIYQVLLTLAMFSILALVFINRISLMLVKFRFGSRQPYRDLLVNMEPTDYTHSLDTVYELIQQRVLGR